MSTAVVPFSAEAIELADDPGEFVVQACERAKGWLVQALEHGDINSILELKSQAEAIRVYTTQKQMGKDAELAAAEIVRRAERGLGLAVKRGQESGTVVPPSRVRHRREDAELVHPNEVFKYQAERADAYVMAEASDEQFETAVTEAKEEGNLSRSNVVRKTARERISGDGIARGTTAVAKRRALIVEMCERGCLAEQISATLGISEEHVRRLARELGVKTADMVIGRTRRMNSNRIVTETVVALEGLVMGIGFVKPDELDIEQVEVWATSLSVSIRSLNRLVKQLKEMAL